MPTRTTSVASLLTLVVDPQSVDQMNGVQIDWANVDAGFLDATLGYKVLPAGTILKASGTGYIERVGNTSGSVGILATEASEGNNSHSLSGYGMYIGGVFYENMMPDSGHADWATIKTEFDANIRWQDLADDTN